MMKKAIYHIAQQEEWNQGKLRGSYWPSIPKGAPFIHFSFASQVIATANRIFSGRNDLVLLKINQSSVERDLKIEAASPEGERYPHLYRALSPAEVETELTFKPSSDGSFSGDF